SGTTLNKIGTSYAIYVDDQSNIYISEYSNHRVTLWFNGNTTAGTIVAGNNTAGSALYQLRNPWGVFVDSMYGIYVVDRGNHRVQYFEKSKHNIFQSFLCHMFEYFTDAVNGTTVGGQSGVPGAFANQFNLPTAITLDQFGNLYILDSGNDRIQQWASGATFGVTVASVAMGTPKGMSFDPFGNLVVADSGNHRVILFPVICRKLD
ncbi:unnamed protein product, partial [Rotaria sp. Silwood2]